MKKALLLIITFLLASCSQPQVDTTSNESTTIKQTEAVTQKTYTNVIYCDCFYYSSYYSDGYYKEKTDHYKICDDYLSINDFNTDVRKIVSMTSVNIEVKPDSTTPPKTHYHLYVCYEN